MDSAQGGLRGAPAAVVALLEAAEARGAIITRTKVAKLLYLADLRAVRDLGEPCSGLTWTWMHYGPYDKSLVEIEASLVSRGALAVRETSNFYGTPEFRLRLIDAPQTEIDDRFAVIVADIVSEYAKLSPSTLKDMTYQTPPMLEAQEAGVRGVRLDLLTGRPVPNIVPTLRRYRQVLSQLERQDTEEDAPAELAGEIAEMSELRARANRLLLG